MRHYLFLLLGVFLFSCNQKDNYSKITVLEYSDSNFVGKGDTVEVAYLNNEMKFISRDIRDNKISRLNVFDKNGRVIRLIVRYNDSFAVQTDKELDKFGLAVKLMNFEIGQLGDTSVFLVKNQYSIDSSFIISSIFDKKQNEIIGLEERSYDSNRNITSLISRDPQSRHIFEKRVFVYDNRKNNIETSLFDSVGNLKGKDIYLYNEKNQLIRESHFENDNLDHYSIYFYEGARRSRGIRGWHNSKEKYLKYYYE